MLEGEGYRVKVGPNALAQVGFVAGPDQDRAADLQHAFEDDETAAVLCSRGGYGCARLLPYLDFPRMAATNKLFLGFSDITTLHLALNQLGLPTAHTPMAISFSIDREPWVHESFLGLLRGDDPIAHGAPNGATLVGGLAEGIVTGGCLCLLTDSIATPYPVDMEGKIVLIEDVDELPHRVDAMLTHLLNAGIIQKAAGIVVGEMTRTDEQFDPTIGSKPWRDIIRERLEPLGIPTIIEFPFGHCPAMLSLPLGIRARLDADAGTLTYLEPLCC